MTLRLPFLAALALAGLAFLLGQQVVRRIGVLREHFVPGPLLGGLLFALGFWLLRGLGLAVEVPTQGAPVDFLVALLTTNMGLHLTPKVVRRGAPLFVLFLGFGLLAYALQLLLALPAAAFSAGGLRTAILAGPLSFVGAPFNLNPPDQTAPLAPLFRPAYPQLEATAQGVMMLGAVSAVFVAGWFGRWAFRQTDQDPPRPSPADRKAETTLTAFANDLTALLVLLLVVITAAFALQRGLQAAWPTFRPDYLPVILTGYLLGGLFRLGFERLAGEGCFPEQALTVLLLGPTMGLVFAYALMSLPLHQLGRLTLPLAGGAVPALLGSLITARVLFPVLCRRTDPYYAAVIATGFLAITTGWGPIGMGYLRRFIDEAGPVEPLPMIMPLSAFYLFPWGVILVSAALLRWLG